MSEVATTFLRRNGMHLGTTGFVLSLVTANMLTSCVGAPLILGESLLTQYLLLPNISNVISTVASTVVFGAVFSTFLIAVDRFYAVTCPLHYSMTITRSRSQIMICLAWVFAVLLSLPYVFLCFLEDHPDLQRNFYMVFTIMQFTIVYLFPFVGLCWLYMRMYHAAHKNSERTRKHSISGELLTVLDGSTSVIPQGIDFLTHYMNPFTRNPMAGSVQPAPNGQQDRASVGQVVPVVAKKTRRRSSNGSASSLLFREEGRAIKTAFFVLASYLLCWTPHFVCMLLNEINQRKRLGHYIVYDNATLVEMDSSIPDFITGRENATDYQPSYFSPYRAQWARFCGMLGMMMSSVLNPFIYVFRNRMANEEISRFFHGLFGGKLLSKDKQPQPFQRDKERKPSDTGSKVVNPIVAENNSSSYEGDNTTTDVVDYQPRYSPCIGKSPKRSSMKSLTPQSSVNSAMTNCNSAIGVVTDSPAGIRGNESSHISFSNGRSAKPPFMRSLTLPEQTQQRVKFPANLTRQKSYAYRPQNNVAGTSQDVTPYTAKRSKFVRQDSICSNMSNDSVLMICCEDGTQLAEVGPLGILNLSLPSQQIVPRGGILGSTISRVPEGDNEEDASTISESSIQEIQFAKCYIRQDSNFSDTSRRTNDSGVVLSSMCSQSKQGDSANIMLSPNHARHLKHLSHPNSSSINHKLQQREAGPSTANRVQFDHTIGQQKKLLASTITETGRRGSTPSSVLIQTSI